MSRRRDDPSRFLAYGRYERTSRKSRTYRNAYTAAGILHPCPVRRCLQCGRPGHVRREHESRVTFTLTSNAIHLDCIEDDARN
ncbi:uncharacterized protein LAESUDRAFT_521226 [Laetiporus sulphureus 93-53]|uniref:CCHC-type domain-containing protein n=1 Tax=Laetiporus sulphureus 93-53 TaxID=1314785 RepID=A0A165G4B6_9APHY|nr:uncharacterized protein LAESUDRAFT_521226 [Laetiporus sulphureus 93-53]KZT09811.1 hypothetical protein LAESUDRAFT_521226 [Laetiporus sulphureus 93-53]